MGPKKLRQASLVRATVVVVVSAVCAQAQSPTIQLRTADQAVEAIPSKEPGALTGKERLGRKWSDEQRLDNCNVPIDKRGNRPRSNECVHAPTI
jgi:hypothetical protein